MLVTTVSFPVWQEAVGISQAAEKEGNTSLQAHLSGRHILEGDMAIS